MPPSQSGTWLTCPTPSRQGSQSSSPRTWTSGNSYTALTRSLIPHLSTTSNIWDPWPLPPARRTSSGSSTQSPSPSAQPPSAWSRIPYSPQEKLSTTRNPTTTEPTGINSIYLFNYRDIQEIKNRKVFFYDREKSCVPYKDPKDKKEVGHWEKVVKDVDRYFFVKGAKPS